MQQLVGRLTALDPEASATLKVVSYFDTLVGHEVGVETLLRGASVLSGCPVGYDPGKPTARLRVSPAGQRLPAGPPQDWPSVQAGPGAVVWLERSGVPHANDAMILERLALAVAISRSRARPAPGLHRAVECVIDGDAPGEDRATAAAQLGLDPRRRVRAVARQAGQPAGDHPSSIVSTPFGLARAEIVPATAGPRRGGPAGRSAGPGHEEGAGARAGIGPAVEPSALPRSWSAALVALRLTDGDSPVLAADELGAVLLLAEAADAAPQPHPDVAALDALAAGQAALPTLDALAHAGTARAAAGLLGLHHSTVQSRLAGAAAILGYDPRTPDGRTRYVLARTLQRLRNAPPL